MEGQALNKLITVEIVVEGPTENKFVKQVLAPYWGMRNIFVHAPVVRTKTDERHGLVFKGGDIRFDRVERQIGNFLSQRDDIVVASFVDYYGIQEWPGYASIQASDSPRKIAERLNVAAKEKICQDYAEFTPDNRYFPFTAVHEFEALLFSDSKVLAEKLGIDQAEVDDALTQCGSPEAINNSPETAPSKRLETWTCNRYGKTTNGIVIAKAIGIDKMRLACPNFDAWLRSIEILQTEE